MSRQTATPPPKPVAALLSPVLWQMEHPDKFDMYSFGVLMLQMAFPNLRSDNSLIAFNRRLQELGWDLKVGWEGWWSGGGGVSSGGPRAPGGGARWWLSCCRWPSQTCAVTTV